MKGRILIADNDIDFLDTRADFLESAGYEVLKASNLAQAGQLLSSKYIQLVILDIRLNNDFDDKDVSGLTLANDSNFQTIPKVILTDHTTVQAVKKTIIPPLDGLPLAVDFVAKADGPQAMTEAVNRAFAKYVRANFGLKLTCSQHSPFRYILRCILGNSLKPNEVDERSNEIEFLFHGLLSNYDEADLEIGRIEHQGKAFIWVRGNKANKAYPPRLVKCGRREDIVAEQRAYEDPSKGELVKPWAILLENAIMSLHFGLISYSAVGFDFTDSRWLVDCFHSLPAGELNATLDDLFVEKVKRLYEQPCQPETHKALSVIYQEALGFFDREQFVTESQSAITETIQTLQSNYLINVESDSTNHLLTMIFPDGQQKSCPDPITVAFTLGDSFGPPILQRISLGELHGHSVLVSSDSRAWLTEFETIKPAPNLSDYINLEVTIRFEWLDAAEIRWDELLKFEDALSSMLAQSSDNPVKPESIGVTELDKALLVISHIRHLATQSFGNNPREYQLGLLFKLIGVLVANESVDDPTTQSRKAYALIAAVLISRVLEPTL